MGERDDFTSALWERERARNYLRDEEKLAIRERLFASIAATNTASKVSQNTSVNSGEAATRTWTTAKPLAIAVAFAAGLGLGALSHALSSSRERGAVQPNEPPTLVSPPPKSIDSPASSAATTPPVEPLSSAARTEPTDHPVKARAPSPPASLTRDLSLSEERDLIEMSRTALSRGQDESALAMLRIHSQRYPKGRLSEERDALSIRALHALGRKSEALARLSAFATAYPASPFLPALRQLNAEQGLSH